LRYLNIFYTVFIIYTQEIVKAKLVGEEIDLLGPSGGQINAVGGQFLLAMDYYAIEVKASEASETKIRQNINRKIDFLIAECEARGGLSF